MALQERIFSLETEYGINFYPDGDSKAPDPKVQVKSLQEVLVEGYGLAGSDFLANGSKFHHDVGHAEWSLPECRSAREAAVYDKAADHLLATIIPQAQQRLARQGFQGTLFVFKNNVDSVGHTFGCHENYLMLRDTDVLGGEAFLRYIVRCLVPFLVTRQIFCGAGRLIPPRSGSDQPPVFQISQRADFIETVVSKETRSERAIVNLGREEEPLAAGNYRRLHLILGDSNLSGWATWMKLGTTGIVLRMIEDLFIGDIPLLADPVAALRQISHDPTCRAPIPLRDGRTMSPIDIQWHYYDLAEEYLDGFGFSVEEEAILEAWGQALEDLEQDPMRLRDRADWVIKKRLMDAFLERLGGSWKHWPGSQEALSGLLGIELRYHDVSQEGLFSRLWKPDTLVAEEEIQQAQNHPPLYTRARIRGKTVALQDHLPVTVAEWGKVNIAGEELKLLDPLEFNHPLFFDYWMNGIKKLEQAVQDAPQDAQRHFELGRAYETQEQYAQAVAAFEEAVRLKQDEPSYLRSLAHTYLVTGRYEEAITCYQRANELESDPKKHGYNGLGEAYRYLGRYDEAITAYQRALELNAEAIFPIENLGQTFLKQGLINEAEKHFRMAIDRSGGNLISLVALGAILLHRGDVNRANSCFSAALSLPERRARLGITSSAMSYFKAVASLALGREDGLRSLERALQHRGPESAEGLFLLKPLLTLLAESPYPPRDVQTALDLTKESALYVSEDRDTRPDRVEGDDWQDALHHPSPYIRIRAVTYLGWQNTEAALTALAQIVQTDPDEQVRRTAVEVLGRIGNEQAVDALIRCLRDPDLVVRWAAEEALERSARGKVESPPAGSPVSPPDTEEHLVQMIS
jgi:proteasome accessory factor A